MGFKSCSKNERYTAIIFNSPTSDAFKAIEQNRWHNYYYIFTFKEIMLY